MFYKAGGRDLKSHRFHIRSLT